MADTLPRPRRMSSDARLSILRPFAATVSVSYVLVAFCTATCHSGWGNHGGRSRSLALARLGVGPLLANPLVGYVVELRTTGRRSGRVRCAPVNYAIIDGAVYCLAGWGRSTHWFANLRANPRVELRLPGSTIVGLAEEVTDPAEAHRAIVLVARNAGIGLLFDGINPLTISDAEILARNGWMPVIRIRPTGIGTGPLDPGGRGWLVPALAFILWLFFRRAGVRKVGAADRLGTDSSLRSE